MTERRRRRRKKKKTTKPKMIGKNRHRRRRKRNEKRGRGIYYAWRCKEWRVSVGKGISVRRQSSRRDLFYWYTPFRHYNLILPTVDASAKLGCESRYRFR